MKLKKTVNVIGVVSVLCIAFISCSTPTNGNTTNGNTTNGNTTNGNTLDSVTKEILLGVWEVKKTTQPLYQDNLPYGLDPNPEKFVPGAEVRTYMYFDNENLSLVKKISGMPSAEHNGSSQVIMGKYEVFSDNSLKLNITGIPDALVFSCTRNGNALVMSAQGEEMELQKTVLTLQMLTDTSGASGDTVTSASLQGVWAVKKMGGKDFPISISVPLPETMQVYFCFNGSSSIQAIKTSSLVKSPMGEYEAAGDNKIKFNLIDLGGIQMTAIHSCTLSGNMLIIPGMAQLELEKVSSPTVTEILNAPLASPF